MKNKTNDIPYFPYKCYKFFISGLGFFKELRVAKAHTAAITDAVPDTRLTIKECMHLKVCFCMVRRVQ